MKIVEIGVFWAALTRPDRDCHRRLDCRARLSRICHTWVSFGLVVVVCCNDDRSIRHRSADFLSHEQQIPGCESHHNTQSCGCQNGLACSPSLADHNRARSCRLAEHRVGAVCRGAFQKCLGAVRPDALQSNHIVFAVQHGNQQLGAEHARAFGVYEFTLSVWMIAGLCAIPHICCSRSASFALGLLVCIALSTSGIHAGAPSITFGGRELTFGSRRPFYIDAAAVAAEASSRPVVVVEYVPARVVFWAPV